MQQEEQRWPHELHIDDDCSSPLAHHLRSRMVVVQDVIGSCVWEASLQSIGRLLLLLCSCFRLVDDYMEVLLVEWNLGGNDINIQCRDRMLH